MAVPSSPAPIMRMEVGGVVMVVVAVGVGGEGLGRGWFVLLLALD
jgi:hypothetical protein